MTRDNTAYKLELWQQYRSSEGCAKYFEFFRDYLQANYFDKLYTVNEETGEFELAPDLWNLSIDNKNTDYLYFYALNVFGEIPPYVSMNYTVYDDILNLYDTTLRYDSGAEGTRVSIQIFRKILKFNYNLANEHWNLLTLVRLVAEFIDVSSHKIHEISVEYSEQRFNTFMMTVPDNQYSRVLRVLIRLDANITDAMQKRIFNLPLGMRLDIQFYND